MTLDTNEIQRLSLMGSALRPDWPARSLQTFISKNLTDRAYADVAVALAWICTRTKTDTPRLLLETGAWWKAANTDASSAPRPPKRHEACADCGRTPDQHHPGPDDEHQWRPVGTAARDRSPDQAERARAELTAARAEACRHGVQRAKVRCTDCDHADRIKPAAVEPA